MRQAVAVLLAILLVAPELPARSARVRDTNDWKNVMKLKRGTSVLVSMWNGDQVAGRLDSVSETGMRVVAPDKSYGHWHEDVQRPNVQRVVRLRGEADLPDPGRVMLIGTAAGIAIGGVTGGIQDATGHNEGRGLAYAAGGGLIGFLGSVVVLGVVSIKALARGYKREEVMYEDKSRRPPDAPQ